MGMHSYLIRVPQYEDTTLEEIELIEKYFDWGRRREEGSPLANCSLKEWCGVNGDELPHKYKINYYREFYTIKPFFNSYFGEIEDVYSISEQIGRFPGAYHIHYWFHRNVVCGQDAEYCKVTKDQLQKLYYSCMIVSDNFAITEHSEYKINKEVAKAVLPMPFDYDYLESQVDVDWYATSVLDTIQVIKNILDTTDFDSQTIYYVAI